MAGGTGADDPVPLAGDADIGAMDDEAELGNSGRHRLARPLAPDERVHRRRATRDVGDERVPLLAEEAAVHVVDDAPGDLLLRRCGVVVGEESAERPQSDAPEIDCSWPGLTRCRAGRVHLTGTLTANVSTDEDVLAAGQALAIPRRGTERGYCWTHAATSRRSGVDAKGLPPVLWTTRRGASGGTRGLDRHARGRPGRCPGCAAASRATWPARAWGTRSVLLGLRCPTAPGGAVPSGRRGLRRRQWQLRPRDRPQGARAGGGRRSGASTTREAASVGSSPSWTWQWPMWCARSASAVGGPELLADKATGGAGWTSARTTSADETSRTPWRLWFSAKDFRTWAATWWPPSCSPPSAATRMPVDLLASAAACGELVKGVAQQLGNTPAVAAARTWTLGDRALRRGRDGRRRRRR